MDGHEVGPRRRDRVPPLTQPLHVVDDPAGATELYPSVIDGGVVHDVQGLGQWWDAVTPARANLMTVHLTSSIRMSQDRTKAGADSFGAVWDTQGLRVNDASLLPEGPGVNPQAAIMTVAARNADHFLATS